MTKIAERLDTMARQALPSEVDVWPEIQRRLQPRRANLITKGRFAQIPIRAQRRVVAVGFIVCLVAVMSTFTFVPAARAWADTSMQALFAALNINRAVLELPVPTGGSVAGNSNETVSPGADLNCTQSSDGTFTCQNATSYDVVATQVGFAIMVPSYLPQGYHLVPHFSVTPDRNTVGWKASSSINPGVMCLDNHLSLSQQKITNTTPDALSVGDASAQTVTVRGQVGVLVERTQPSSCSERRVDGTVARTVTVTRNVLVWEQEGIRYTLISGSQLPTSELLQVAEGLRK